VRLEGKVALITGAARGIGEAIARRFVQEGARVAICDIADETGSVLADTLGERAHYMRLDVGSKVQWQAVVAKAEAVFGPLNILVNNAGIGGGGYVENFSEEEFNKILTVNQTGTLLGMQAALSSLRKGGRGSIVNISSLQGIEVDVGLTAYVASKFGVRGLTKSAALELGREGIRANSVHPGMIRTPMMGGHSLPDDFFGHIPLRRAGYEDRAGYPQDVANLVLFLASDEAGYVTAAEFVIDGGKSVRFATGGTSVGSRLGEGDAIGG
jgi:3alpha(or 20beta)-hydroxysteroid dehydrogenase